MPQQELLKLVIARLDEAGIEYMKLKWARMSGGSEKQFIDALRVYEVQHGLLDQSYLDAWAAQA